MLTDKFFSSRNRDLALVLSALVGLVILFHLGTAWKGEGRYRDQHLGAALHYAETKISLANTIIPGFNATETPTILELPVWQMAAGLAFKCLGSWWGWANVVSLLLFLNCLYPLFRVVAKYYGDRTAWWSLIFFLSQALVFAYAGEAGTDSLCLALSLWFWFACARMLDAPGKWFLPAAALGALTAVSKLPFFMAAGLAAFLLLLNVHGWKWRHLLALAGVGVLSGAVFLAWTRYTEAIQAGAVLPFADLRLSGTTEGTSMWYWYFGDWHYRLNPGNWIKAAWRLAGATFGSYTLIALFLYALVGRRFHPVAKLFLLGSLLTTLVFTHVILHHYHYLMLFSPAVAILCAAGLQEVESRLKERGVKPGIITLTAALVLLAGLFQGLLNLRAFSWDKYPATIAAAIRAHTRPADRLVVINGGWGGDQLIRSGRRGLSAWNTRIFEDAEKYAQLKKLGFNRLVIISESPYQNAIRIVNPGQTGIPRPMARDWVTPQVKSWPTVLETEDLVIKEIP